MEVNMPRGGVPPGRWVIWHLERGLFQGETPEGPWITVVRAQPIRSWSDQESVRRFAQQLGVPAVGILEVRAFPNRNGTISAIRAAVKLLDEVGAIDGWLRTFAESTDHHRRRLP